MRKGRLAHSLALVLLVLSQGCGSPNPDPRVRFGAQALSTGLEIPQGVAFTPDGRLFITERSGQVRVYRDGTLLAEPALTLTDVFTKGERNGLTLTVHPDFSDNHFVYLTYTADGARGPIGRVMRFREEDNRFLDGVVMLDDVPASVVHNGAL